ncbi:biotin attachment protein [Martelella mediterranea]|uniref:Acetyl/propionyl-CoA carboxylase, alpha subunit n=1 Tax=Martelella mediterranea DSM 17316 TaxID=1122214 RepID=A0A1U9Z0D9_9HYPH|nr:biotin attachment protein [Martelella mediterranea]AQZ51155.1 Acetyl/propionyl-CoA carboxylase, alpha subunit [Martelella mediterranea DSM 17316]
MKPAEIAALAERMRAVGAYGLDVNMTGFSLRVRLAAAAAAERIVPDRARKQPSSTVAAETPGLFRAAEQVRGGAVSAGDVVAFIDAGPLAFPVLAHREARLGLPLVREGEAVEFGQVLFEHEEI